MREIRQSGSEGGVALTTPSLPLSGIASGGGLQIRETAECNSTLRVHGGRTTRNWRQGCRHNPHPRCVRYVAQPAEKSGKGKVFEAFRPDLANAG